MDRFVFDAMGTVVSVQATAISDAARRDLRRVFDELEDRFTLYRPDSEASAVARRDLLVPHASPSTAGSTTWPSTGASSPTAASPRTAPTASSTCQES